MYWAAVLNDLFIVKLMTRSGTAYAWQEKLEEE
jgi:hypothetical protein